MNNASNKDVGFSQIGISLQFPGDVSPYAKNVGPQIPLHASFVSIGNIILLLGIATISPILSWLYGRKQKL